MIPKNRKRAAIWSDVPDAEWNDWHWQHKNRIRSLDVLEKVIEVSADERRAYDASVAKFNMAITPYYASLMDPKNPNCPVRLQSVPNMGELNADPDELEDPLGEEKDMPVPGLTHRYPDRVLFYTTHHCPVYCRHCTRKRKVSDPSSAALKAQIEGCFKYLREHKEVRDVIISGGDPLSFSDDKLEEILQTLRDIPHIEVLRLGTRNPVTLPQRITPAFVEMLKKYHPIFVHTHFNHTSECTPEAAQALKLLADAGCNIGNQMVLMKGINEDPQMVLTMYRWLLKQRVRPYYMFQCDLAEGISHFRTPIETGLNILRHLIGHTSGMAIPRYVVDLPGGGGKVPVFPDYLVEKKGRILTFKNFKGEIYDYPEPELDSKKK